MEEEKNIVDNYQVDPITQKSYKDINNISGKDYSLNELADFEMSDEEQDPLIVAQTKFDSIPKILQEKENGVNTTLGYDEDGRPIIRKDNNSYNSARDVVIENKQLFEEYKDLYGRDALASDVGQYHEVAVNKSNWEQAGNSLGGFTANAASGFLGGIASWDLQDGVDMLKGVNKEYGNWINDLAVKAREAGEDFKVYEVNPGSFSPGDSGWWFTQFSQLGTTAGIMAETLVETAILSVVTGGLGAGLSAAKNVKLLKRLTEIARKGGLKSLLKSEGSKQLFKNSFKSMGNQALWGSFKGAQEGIIEGYETYHQTYSEYVGKGFPPDEAQRLASIAASTTYKQGVLPLMLLNSLQFATMSVNPLTGASKGLYDKIGNKFVRKGAEMVSNMASEGTEEFIQNMAQTSGAQEAAIEAGELKRNWKNTLGDELESEENWNAFAGGLMGGQVFTGLHSAFNRGAKKAQEKHFDTLSDDYVKAQTEKQTEIRQARKKRLEENDIFGAKMMSNVSHVNHVASALEIDKRRDSDTAIESVDKYYQETLKYAQEGNAEKLAELGITSEEDVQHVIDTFPELIETTEVMKEAYKEAVEYNDPEFASHIAEQKGMLHATRNEKNLQQKDLDKYKENSEYNNLTSEGKTAFDEILRADLNKQEIYELEDVVAKLEDSVKKIEEEVSSSENPTEGLFSVLKEANEKKLKDAKKELKDALYRQAKQEQSKRAEALDGNELDAKDKSIIKSLRGQMDPFLERQNMLDVLEKSEAAILEDVGKVQSTEYQKKKKLDKAKSTVLNSEDLGSIKAAKNELFKAGALTAELRSQIASHITDVKAKAKKVKETKKAKSTAEKEAKKDSKKRRKVPATVEGEQIIKKGEEDLEAKAKEAAKKREKTTKEGKKVNDDIAAKNKKTNKQAVPPKKGKKVSAKKGEITVEAKETLKRFEDITATAKGFSVESDGKNSWYVDKEGNKYVRQSTYKKQIGGNKGSDSMSNDAKAGAAVGNMVDNLGRMIYSGEITSSELTEADIATLKNATEKDNESLRKEGVELNASAYNKAHLTKLAKTMFSVKEGYEKKGYTFVANDVLVKADFKEGSTGAKDNAGFKGVAGVLDLVAVGPDGSVEIIDFKNKYFETVFFKDSRRSAEMDKKIETVSKKDWTPQQTIYKTLLESYGIKVDDIKIMPIASYYKRDDSKNVGIGGVDFKQRVLITLKPSDGHSDAVRENLEVNSEKVKETSAQTTNQETIAEQDVVANEAPTKQVDYFAALFNAVNGNSSLEINDEVIKYLIDNELLEEDCTGGKIKAENGANFGFTPGSKWKVVKDLKGHPSHAKGGVDVNIDKSGVSFTKGNSNVKAKHGLIIGNNG